MNVKMETVWIKLKKISNKKFVRYAVPFFTLIGGATIGIREFAKLRYQYSGKKSLSYEEARELGIDMKKPDEVTLETEYEKIRTIDIQNWENKRIPRPWEENVSS